MEVVGEKFVGGDRVGVRVEEEGGGVEKCGESASRGPGEFVSQRRGTEFRSRKPSAETYEGCDLSDNI